LPEALRLAIYRQWFATGRAPLARELAEELACGVAEVEAGLRELAAAHVIVTAAGSCEIAMAHPFSGVPTAYSVSSGGVGYWANCAWDALGIAAILGRDTEARARCADCAEEVDLSVRGGVPVDPSGVVHLLVPAKKFWDDIAFT
jgi:hypothetical protein